MKKKNSFLFSIGHSPENLKQFSLMILPCALCVSNEAHLEWDERAVRTKLIPHRPDIRDPFLIQTTSYKSKDFIEFAITG